METITSSWHGCTPRLLCRTDHFSHTALPSLHIAAQFNSTSCHKNSSTHFALLHNIWGSSFVVTRVMLTFKPLLENFYGSFDRPNVLSVFGKGRNELTAV